MKAVAAETLPWQEYLHPREGRVELKMLITGCAGSKVNFALALTRYSEGEDAFRTPRHHHTFSQIRLALQGSSNYAKGKEIPEGWVGYFPAGAYYGPQHVSGGEILLLQFGPKYLTEEEKRRGQQEMAEFGNFHDGVFTTTDPQTGRRHNRDGVQAIFEHIHREPMRYPPPCYPEPILMNPAAFGWVDVSPGAQAKTLGRFGPGDVHIEYVRLEQGEMTTDVDHAQLLFTTTGTFTVDGHDGVEPHTAIFSEPGEATSVCGASCAEALLVRLPVG